MAKSNQDRGRRAVVELPRRDREHKPEGTAIDYADSPEPQAM